MNKPKWSAVLLIAILAALVGCGSKGQEKVAAQAPPPTVEITQAAPGDADIYVEYPGQTYARNMVDVRGRVEGYIEKWLFRPGQEVTAGQALYVLDLRPFQAQVQQAQGTLKQTEADLDFANRQVSLRQAEANLAASQSNLVKAQQDYERLKPLVEQDAAARQELDAAVATLRSAEASVRANQANVEQTKLTTETQVQSTQGKVQAQHGALETASLNVQYGTIRAPISGLIGDTLVPVGGLVNPNATQPLTTIVPLDPIFVRFKVSEAQYLEFMGKKGGPAKEGPALHLVLADNTVFPSTGKITNTLNQVDPRTGTLELQAEFPNPQHRLLPGQFGRVRYVAEHRTGVILIPQRAVQQNQSIQTVYTVGPGDKIESRPVKTGARVGDSWLIEQGIDPGDRVVVEGLLTVRPGAVVHPIPYQDKPAAQRKAS
ncbi:MAG: efflux transporter, family, subunit [Candidatus Solibacter sp.]|nr:efflux transporter, family, subunit [Candidatus Solibacter sp.]